MGLFGNRKQEVDVPGVTAPPAEQPGPTQSGRQKKAAPTPSRRDAEEARRQRVNPVLSPKQARQREAAARRVDRAKAMDAVENRPERALLRDWVDARRNLGEYLLPSLIVLLALQFLSTVIPDLQWIAVVLMYTFIAIVIIDIALMWRGFKKLLARKLPKSSPRGLLMYGAMRVTQIRRFRTPPPAVERGHKF